MKRLSVLALVCGLSGCASVGNPQDPLEGFNRAMFRFNDAVDQVALKPGAEIYQSVLPSFVQTGIGNFFGNLADIPTALNDFLQGKAVDGLNDVMRVGVNTTFGLVGVLDIASEAGIPKHREDFGQTLGKWGVPAGPYVVLPVFGSSTLRDAAMLPVDLSVDPWLHKNPVRWRNTGSFIRLVDQRAAVLNASNLIEEAALDRYEFVRDAYLQRRENKVYDGEIPLKKKYDEGAAGPTTDPQVGMEQRELKPEPVIKLEQNNSVVAESASLLPPRGQDGSATDAQTSPLSSDSTAR